MHCKVTDCCTSCCLVHTMRCKEGQMGRVCSNNSPLDVFGLYREVTRHGGFVQNEAYDDSNRWTVRPGCCCARHLHCLQAP